MLLIHILADTDPLTENTRQTYVKWNSLKIVGYSCNILLFDKEGAVYF